MTLQTSSRQETIRIKRNYLRAKRVVDIIFVLLIMIPLCLVIAVIALLIYLDSEGPIFFRQKRVGTDGVEFEMLKFRSMYTNCDDAIHRANVARYFNGETTHKVENDPRITRIGHFLRKTSLDELPQFINILRGEMTLVGPRPALPYEVAYYSSHDWLRLSGKPGLTGLWQIYGRSKVTFQMMVEMDIKYLLQQSIWLDLKLVVLTIPLMLFKRSGE